MIKGKLVCFYLISLSLISTAEVLQRNSDTDRSRKRIVTDPVSNFFSEVGDLFLDVDRALAIQTAPKVEYEDGLVSQILRPSTNYFNAVQKNYRSLQNRLGTLIRESIGPKRDYKDRELSTVSPTKLVAGIDEVSASTHPDSVQTNKSPFKEAEDSDEGDIQEHDCSENPFLRPYEREKCFQRLARRVDPDYKAKKGIDKLILDARRENDLPFPLDIEPLEDLRKLFFRRDGDASESKDTKPEGRIIGDLLYSESSLDRQLRKFLREHGRWMLDNPLFIRWRKSSESSTKDANDITTETSNEETQSTTIENSFDVTSEVESTEATTLPTTTQYEIENLRSEKSRSGNELPVSSNYYRILTDDGIIEQDHIAIRPLPHSEDVDSMETEVETREKFEARETVILAFTPDGVPLKLRMGPEIENPVKFLHKALKSAGVSLNVPVESYEDIEPVGKEVLKFGAGILTRSVYFDLSNKGELKSLLKTLMKSKSGRVRQQ